MGRTKQKKHGKPTFAIIVDGKTEAWYLHMLQRNERNMPIHIKPEIPQKKSLKDQFNLLCEVSEVYAKVFWILDFDTIIKEDKETPKGKKSPLTLFKEYREIILKKYKNVIIIINNPCFEFWLLLHFVKTSKYYNQCSEVIGELQKHIKDYEKTQKFYTAQNNDIYKRLQPRLATAIKNAWKVRRFDAHNPHKALCQMGLLFQSDELKHYLHS